MCAGGQKQSKTSWKGKPGIARLLLPLLLWAAPFKSCHSRPSSSISPYSQHPLLSHQQCSLHYISLSTKYSIFCTSNMQTLSGSCSTQLWFYMTVSHFAMRKSNLFLLFFCLWRQIIEFFWVTMWFWNACLSLFGVCSCSDSSERMC